MRRHHGKRKSVIGSSERESAPCPQSSPHEKRLINVFWNCRKTFIVEPEIHFVRDTEVLAPSTARDDRVTKMPVYARHGVPCLWPVDPLARSLEAFALEQGRQIVAGLCGDPAEANIQPFQKIALQLTEL